MLFKDPALMPQTLQITDVDGGQWTVNISRMLGRGRALIRMSVHGGEIPSRWDLERGIPATFLVATRPDLEAMDGDPFELQDTLTSFIVGCVRQGLVRPDTAPNPSRAMVGAAVTEAMREHFQGTADLLFVDNEVASHECRTAFMELSSHEAAI